MKTEVHSITSVQLPPSQCISAPAVTIVVPAWNESANLPSCLAAITNTFVSLPIEVIIVNDGSTDDTLSVAQQCVISCAHPVRVISHDVNRGIGGALSSGFAAAEGNYLMCCPADFEMHEEDWAPFANCLGEADVLVGCRRARTG